MGTFLTPLKLNALEYLRICAFYDVLFVHYIYKFIFLAFFYFMHLIIRSPRFRIGIN